jgi:hypothetical protein
MTRIVAQGYGSSHFEPRQWQKTVRRNAVAMRFWRARHEKRGYLDLGLCDPLPNCRSKADTGYTRGLDLYAGTQRAFISAQQK